MRRGGWGKERRREKKIIDQVKKSVGREFEGDERSKREGEALGLAAAARQYVQEPDRPGAVRDLSTNVVKLKMSGFAPQLVAKILAIVGIEKEVADDVMENLDSSAPDVGTTGFDNY